MNVWTVLRALWYWCEIRQKTDFHRKSFFHNVVEVISVENSWKGDERMENSCWNINLQHKNCWTSFEPHWKVRIISSSETCSANFHAFLWRWHHSNPNHILFVEFSSSLKVIEWTLFSLNFALLLLVVKTLR